MKQTILLFALTFLVNTVAIGQEVIDDIYFTPSDAKKEVKKDSKTADKQNTTYKNGAKKIIFVERDTTDAYVAIAEDSVEVDKGYYLNEFEGTESDYEYAERIRRFHNPKYTVFISDPNYNDIYFLDNNYWNVYIDGSSAYVTPSFSNPYWFDYMYRPYNYSSWAWRNSWYG
ncbi:MAG: hypothetical protein LBV75_05600, partial [Paludibacter sp.]|nr:hypothetical protein [Paludibacter sp.]